MSQSILSYSCVWQLYESMVQKMFNKGICVVGRLRGWPWYRISYHIVIQCMTHRRSVVLNRDGPNIFVILVLKSYLVRCSTEPSMLSPLILNWYPSFKIFLSILSGRPNSRVNMIQKRKRCFIASVQIVGEDWTLRKKKHTQMFPVLVHIFSP